MNGTNFRKCKAMLTNSFCKFFVSTSSLKFDLKWINMTLSQSNSPNCLDQLLIHESPWIKVNPKVHPKKSDQILMNTNLSWSEKLIKILTFFLNFDLIFAWSALWIPPLECKICLTELLLTTGWNSPKQVIAPYNWICCMSNCISLGAIMTP